MKRIPAQPRPRIVVVIGPPGAGKGTVCKSVGHAIHISTGDVCRDHVARGTELGRQFDAFMKRGDFVADEIMIQMVLERLAQPDVATGQLVLLDGFPRTHVQAQRLCDAVTVERAILIQASDDVCVHRIIDRVVDPTDGTSYNRQSAPPPTQEIASRCVRRSMDQNEDNIRVRLRAYYRNLGGILSVFSAKIFAIDGTQPINICSTTMRNVLEAPVADIVAAVAPPAAAPSAPMKKLCVICQDNDAEYCAAPCGHICGCMVCLSGQEKCPICRTPIASVIRVYQSGVDDDDNESVAAAQQQHVAPIIQMFDYGEGDYGEGEYVGQGEYGGEYGGEGEGAHKKQKPIERISISIAPSAATNIELPRTHVAVTMNIPDDFVAEPVDICCVIDVSGSMGEEAQFQDPNDETKHISEGMNQLDIVKHAVKTVVLTLSEHDRICIVAFSSDATLVLTLTSCTQEGKDAAVAAVESLDSNGATNIWAGLECGLNALRASIVPNRRRFIFFLTDGQPSDSPPKGEPACLADYFEVYPDFKCMVSTFGFGYQLKSALLLDIAREGNGTFSFIPDAALVGTVLVDSVANARTCICLDAKVHLTALHGASFAPQNPIMDMTLPWKQVPWGIVVRIGPIHAGQSRDLVALMNGITGGDAVFLQATLELEKGTKVTSADVSRVPTNDSMVAEARNAFCRVVSSIIAQCDEKKITNAKSVLGVLIGQIKTIATTMPTDTRVATLIEDLEGRITKTLTARVAGGDPLDRFNRWGRHYLRAILRAHQYQMCTNFMDKGLQQYGGTQFNELLVTGGRIFLALPMKKYSDNAQQEDPFLAAAAQHQRAPHQRAPNQRAPNQRAPQPQPQPQNVNYYGGGGGGCFGADCTVRVFPDKLVRICELQRGDKVVIADGTWALVDFVVELVHPRDDMIKIEPNELIITPRHPIARNQLGQRSVWMRAENYAVFPPKRHRVESVWNVVFTTRPNSGMWVNGIECAPWYHYITSMQHEFYSTYDIILALQKFECAENGHVRIIHSSLKEAAASI